MSVGFRRGAGAIEQFDIIRFGGPTRVAESSFDVGETARILRNNPDRVMVIISNNGPDALYWSTQSDAAFPAVQQLGTGQQMVFQVQNDGALCGVEIWATASVAQCLVNVLELIRDRAV